MINETISNNGISATTNPTAMVSDILIFIDGSGDVMLECSADGTKWAPVGNVAGASNIYTPDTGLQYRFRGLNLEGSASVYMGP